MIPRGLIYKVNEIPVASHGLLEFALVLGIGITAGSLGII